MLLTILLTLASFASSPAAASRLGGNSGSDRLLIADPSPALRTFLSVSGFRMDDVESLEAFDLSLMVVSPPRSVPASAALHALQERFPTAILALDDPFYLAHDARAGRGTDLQRILRSIGWQPDGAAAGARIGIIDSTLDLAHPALQGAPIVRRTFTSGKVPTTDTAHGTAIAAMLVGRSNGQSIAGLLRGATLLHASIFQKGGLGPMASSADFLRAVNWLVESGVTVINASITSPTENAVVIHAMSMLSRERTILVAAAGNEGPGGPPVYPAALESAFAVTAVSLGGEVYQYANTGEYIDMAAPGVDLPTTSSKITSGTSLAVPFVTAAVARMVHACGISPLEAEASLQANARDLGPRGKDSHFGWGLLQAPSCTAPQLSARR